MAGPAGLLFVHVLFPLWVAAGLADWACHRATAIERTSGLEENLLHWLMFVQMGVLVIAVALLEINAAVLLLMAAAFLAHELTVWWDLRHTVPLRRVGPFEQMVHSFQEMLPLVVIALAAVTAWDQALALLGRGPAPDLGLRWKDQPLPATVLLTGLAAVLLFNALPLAQETWACVRERRRARAS